MEPAAFFLTVCLAPDPLGAKMSVQPSCHSREASMVPASQESSLRTRAAEWAQVSHAKAWKHLRRGAGRGPARCNLEAYARAYGSKSPGFFFFNVFGDSESFCVSQ